MRAVLRRLIPARRGSRAGLLRLFADYVPADRIAGIAAELGETRRGGFRAPPRILMILFASRAGSAYAGRLLGNTPWFPKVGESFRPDQLATLVTGRGLRDAHAAAQWMLDRRGSPQAFAFKGGLTQLVATAELGLLPEIVDRMEIVILKRRDTLAQAVSLFRAQASGRYHSVQAEGRALTADDYDADRIAFNLAHIARNYRYFDALARRLGKIAPVYHYEDVSADPTQFVASICALLDLPMPADYSPEVDVRVLRDALSAEWIERFRAERGEAAC